MKENYEKPELKIHEDAVFEKVYAGGCTKSNGRSGCVWDASYLPNGGGENPSGHNSHKNLDPGEVPS